MNINKNLTKEERNIVNIHFYEACKDLFNLLKENKINSLELKEIVVRNNFIHKGEEVSEGMFVWTNWKPIAKLKKDGSIKKRLFLSPEEEIEFTNAYNNTYREEALDEINRINNYLENAKVR